MAKNIYFIDTSILMEILKVPNRFSRDKSEQFSNRLVELSTNGNSLIIMPISVIIETGNHINHIKNNPVEKKRCFEQFIDILNLIKEESAPWILFGYQYVKEDLAQIIAKSSELIVSNTGMGDAFIIESFDRYIKTLPKGVNINIEIWSTDNHLSAHSINNY